MSSRLRVTKHSHRLARNAPKLVPNVPRAGGVVGNEDPTERQQIILDFIKLYIEKNGMPPAVSEIARAFDILPNAVQGHIVRLRAKGLLKEPPYPGASRSIVPT